MSGQFNIFELYARQVRKNLRGFAAGLGLSKKQTKQLKQSDNQSLLAECYYTLPGDSEILLQSITSEIDWNLLGRQILFPGSASFFERLVKSKFSLPEGEEAQLDLPHNTFLLAMPRGMSINGIKIPSPLVTYTNNLEERVDQFQRIDRVLNTGISVGEFIERESAFSCVTIFFHNPGDAAGTTTKLTLSLGQLGRVLQLDLDDPSSVDQFSEIAGFNPDGSILSLELDRTDLFIQMALMRLVSGLSVYLSATDSSVLSDGLPERKTINFPGLDAKTKPVLNEIPVPAQTRTAEASGILGTRTWHFRNLRAERFYRGEYATLPRGSRWTLVREAQLGRYKPTTVSD